MALFKEVNGPASPFILDALLSEVSVKCDLEKGEASISDTVAEMRKVSRESNYTTQGKVMFALTLVQDYMIKHGSKSGLSELEVRQKACFRPIKMLEDACIETLNQLGYQVTDIQSMSEKPLHVFVEKLQF